MKNYESEIDTPKRSEDNYRFADEKEWRYVPSADDARIIVKGEFYHSLTKDEYNNSIANLRLKFEPNDISYVIIKSEDEIPEFIQILRDSKGNKYTYNDVNILTSKIITSEQIRTDF